MSEERSVTALLSPQDAARELGMSLRTLRAHVDDGTIPRVITGRGAVRRRFAFDPADIEAFKRSHKEFGGTACLSGSRRSRRSTSMTSSSEPFDFQARLAKLRAQKPAR